MVRKKKSRKKVFYVRKGMTEQEKEYENNSISINHQRLMREKTRRK